ncbi:hypothetical protein SVIOM342S_02057 [Streptomyces violaceorubidus]
MLIATPMAYVMARRRGRLTKAATGWVVVSQAFPFVLLIIPLFLVLKNLGLINSVPRSPARGTPSGRTRWPRPRSRSTTAEPSVSTNCARLEEDGNLVLARYQR